MTKQEFESMTGLQVTDEQMWKIHEVYVNAGEDKDVFCKMVKTMGKEGIDFLCAIGMKMTVDRGHIEDLQQETDELEEFIFQQSVEPDESLVVDKALELFGKDEYYARLLENDITLDADAREYVASKLRA